MISYSRSMLKMLLVLLVWGFSVRSFAQNTYETKTATEGGYAYEYVTNDPLGVRIYTLSNGLKVYLSAYKNEPRIQTYIAVKAGGKNDPAHATGLAHYLEHMMFKGTDEFGTQNWTQEKPKLDEIEQLYEEYRTLTDEAKRKEQYSKIDKISNEAAKLAIANEYDKMVGLIGAKGTNAYTTEDRTVYINDIPANEVEKWLKIESERFSQIVLRLFHTELEAVYEEKNRSLDNDGWKAWEKMCALLFEKHQYGTQTVIGTIDHLKNPSMTEISRYFNRYYIPNNYAICMSGDLDFTTTIRLVDKYFGKLEAKQMQPFTKIQETAFNAPKTAEVLGPEGESVLVGYRLDINSFKDRAMNGLISMLLSNAQAGLIDLNIKQKQKAIEPFSFYENMNDYNLIILGAQPREGQKLEEVKDLLNAQIDLLKEGKFDDWLIKAVITDMEVGRLRSFEKNENRAHEFVYAYTQNADWKEYISRLEYLKTVTKQDVMEYVKKNFQNNCAIVYKKVGEDPNKVKVDKPEITKVDVNRDVKSPFYDNLGKIISPRLTPLFLDYQKDIQSLKTKAGVEVLYNQNKENKLFSLYYLLERGQNDNPKMALAAQYLQYLGSTTMSAEDIQKEFYKIGCYYEVSTTENRTYVMLSGLQENMEKAMELMESVLSNPKADQEALTNLVADILKKREDAKKDKRTILFQALTSYAKYGKKSPFTNVITEADLRNIKGEELCQIIKDMMQYEHKVLFYGAADAKSLLASLDKKHITPKKLKALPAKVQFTEANTDEPTVYWTNYDMVQSEIIFLSKGGKYDKTLVPQARLYNEYFGGGMGGIVFQEMREARALAYSVYSTYESAKEATKSNYIFAYIGTQSDKLPEAMRSMLDLINNMPESENHFSTSKEGLMSQIESERTTKANVLFNYLNAQQLGLTYDLRKDVYEYTKKATLNDIKKFQQQFVKDKKYVIVVVGSKDKLNFEELKKYGKLQELSLEEIFGY